MKLEYEHFRLGGALDELKPLLIKTGSPSDTIMEAFEQPTAITSETIIVEADAMRGNERDASFISSHGGVSRPLYSH